MASARRRQRRGVRARRRAQLCTLALIGALACAPDADRGRDPHGAPTPSADAPATSAAIETTTESSEPIDGDAVGGDTAAAWFRDVTTAVGVDFRHRDGRSGRRYYPETVASGGGWFDADGDGALDLYLLNGAASPGAPADLGTPRNALYLQRDGRFVEVAADAGADDPGYGMGLCAGDYDADGLLDLYLTNYGQDRLLRNLGPSADGVPRFADVTAAVGLADLNSFSTNCAFADLDRDGDLDLYVATYVDVGYDRHPTCGDAARGIASYCRPLVFDGQPDRLWVQQRAADGAIRFRDEAAARGLHAGRDDRAFGVIVDDLDHDGAPDVLVAVDGTANRVYRNDGRGHFRDIALRLGLAVNRDGRAEAGMGQALGDLDGDGRDELIVTNYAYETHTVYRADADGFFDDRTGEHALAAASWRGVGWGVQLFDADNDGDLDLAVAQGHVMDNIDRFEDGIGYPQPNLLFENRDGRLVDVTAQAGFGAARVSRALAVGDWNDDGWLDLLVTTADGRPQVLENAGAARHGNRHWLRLTLRGGPGDPFALGARVEMRCGEAGDPLMRLPARTVRSGGSLLAQDDLRLHVGLGSCTGPVVGAIHWPDGAVQALRVDAVDRTVTIVRDVVR